VIVLVLAAVLSAALILLIKPYLQRFSLARPVARSSHITPTPQGGGAAVIAASIGTPLLIGGIAPQLADANILGLWPIFAAAAFLAIVGAIDDMRTIAVAPRFVLQCIAVCAVVAALPAELRIVHALPWTLERALLIAAMLWFVNLVNFMDGIDWITVGAVVPMAAAIALLGMLGVLPVAITIVALALCGGLIGFAPFNRPVASLFLGDVGSLPIGLLLSWMLVLLAGYGHLAAALLVPLYYLADATVTLLRRLLSGEPVWLAHRTHFYQRATAGGFSVMQVVTRVFAVNIVLAALAVVTVLWPTLFVQIAALAAGVVIVASLLAIFNRGKR
jgi:UDP-N-acetylmuramyl pentapeptide phosphotransferase/UDP-N-acetylglucosamine-1-phosphate transferase